MLNSLQDRIHKTKRKVQNSKLLQHETPNISQNQLKVSKFRKTA